MLPPYGVNLTQQPNENVVFQMIILIVTSALLAMHSQFKIAWSFLCQTYISDSVFCAPDRLEMDVTKTMNGEWGMGNGEWGLGNGEWGMGNGGQR